MDSIPIVVASKIIIGAVPLAVYAGTNEYDIYAFRVCTLNKNNTWTPMDLINAFHVCTLNDNNTWIPMDLINALSDYQYNYQITQTDGNVILWISKGQCTIHMIKLLSMVT